MIRSVKGGLKDLPVGFLVGGSGIGSMGGLIMSSGNGTGVDGKSSICGVAKVGTAGTSFSTVTGDSSTGDGSTFSAGVPICDIGTESGNEASERIAPSVGGGVSGGLLTIGGSGGVAGTSIGITSEGGGVGTGAEGLGGEVITGDVAT